MKIAPGSMAAHRCKAENGVAAIEEITKAAKSGETGRGIENEKR